ncbi:ParA family protein [Lacrimispora amygdalina]|uniref:ParA family protein n=1 Tax=Lacrimispora amygdalina TaxID=253257 RepID=A0A3E2N3S9_9FIRM|nr:ParA family protein [Clostridium indicum]RFZ75625.1 ParA family protein [Clostridium indicum]
MTIISISNLKGGVGKSFTAAQLGYSLSQGEKKNVLLLENDKQGNLSKLFGRYNRNGLCPTAQLLMRRSTAEEVSEETDYPGLDIISANMSLLTAGIELQKDNTEDQCKRFESLKFARNRAGNQYDYVIIDNPPDIGLNVINALAVTNDVIVPIKIDQWALEGMDLITGQIEQIKQINPGIRFAGALVTMYKNNSTNTAGVEWLKRHDIKMFDTYIRYSDKAAESTLFQKPIQEYSPRSGTARSYRQFVQEYITRSGAK